MKVFTLTPESKIITAESAAQLPADSDQLERIKSEQDLAKLATGWPMARLIDLPGNAVVLAWRDDPGFGEVIQPVNPSCRVVLHDEHNTAAAFRPREQNEVIGAEVEHWGKGTREREPKLPRPWAAPLWG